MPWFTNHQMLALFKIPKHCSKQQFILKNYLWRHFSLSLFLGDCFRCCHAKLPGLQYSDHRPILTKHHSRFIWTIHNAVLYLYFGNILCSIMYENLAHAQANTQKKSWKLWNNGTNFERKNYDNNNNDTDDKDDSNNKNTIMQMDTKKTRKETCRYIIEQNKSQGINDK